MSKAKTRRTGFSWPPSGLQVGTIVGLLGETAVFYGLVLPNYSHSVHTLLLCAYTLFLTSVFVSGFMTCYIDPSDLAVKMKWSPHSYPHMNCKKDIVCTVCETSVAAESTHCSTCNRCTTDFEHHCVWVNNCIGRENYHWFFALVGALEGLMVVQTVASFGLTLEVFSMKASENRILAKYAIKDNGLCFLLVLLSSDVTSTMIVLANGFLFLFHLFLRMKSTSTHRYLLTLQNRPVKVLPKSSTSIRKESVQSTVWRTKKSLNQSFEEVAVCTIEKQRGFREPTE